jgi:hypothetical protein
MERLASYARSIFIFSFGVYTGIVLMTLRQNEGASSIGGTLVTIVFLVFGSAWFISLFFLVAQAAYQSGKPHNIPLQ